MKNIWFILSFILISFSGYANSPKITIEEYIDTWKDVAILQMKDHKIPASITLAQGILESGFGNSKLAVKANNHFGIKCHDWKGKTFHQDDDKKNECFRKYKNAMQSFEDHSEFLTGRERYAFLFNLDITDYKGWAKGLRQAGYATSPTYAQKLINLIERYQLNQYDILEESEWIADVRKPKKEKKTKAKQNSNTTSTIVHKVHVNENKTKYVIAGENDTYYQIAKEFGLNIKQLHKWNDFPKNKDLLTAGDKIYIMRKRKSIPKHLVEQNLSSQKELWRVAQDYGVQLEALMQKNKSIANSIAMSQ